MSALFDRIFARCNEVGECWEWTGCMQSCQTTPMINYKGRPQSVRRLLATELGLPLTNRLATVRCMNRLCVNPEHIQTLTRKVMQARVAKANPAVMSPSRMMRIALKARVRAKLDLDKVAQIRQMLEEGIPQRAIGEKFGVSQNCISRIKRDTTWRDYSNPYLQLMR